MCFDAFMKQVNMYWFVFSEIYLHFVCQQVFGVLFLGFLINDVIDYRGCNIIILKSERSYECCCFCCISELALASAFVVQMGFSLISSEGRKNAYELHPIPCTNPCFPMELLCYHMFPIVWVQRLSDLIAEDGIYYLPCRHLRQGCGWSMEVSYG